MTLALTRSTAPPLVIPRSPARSRVLAATNELQRAVDQLFEEAREQAREKARRDAENDAKAQSRIAKAKARAATREYRVEVPAKWFWNFSAEALNAMHELAKEARNQGQISIANSWANRADEIAGELERIQKREVAR